MITEIDIDVRYPDCDPMSIVHHAVYPVWYEIARMDFFQKLGFGYAEMHALGIDPRKIEIAYAAHCEGSSQQCEDILKYVGIVAIEMHNIENACASGGTAFHLCYKDIASGLYDVGLVVGCESMTTCSKAGGLVGVAGLAGNYTANVTISDNAATNVTITTSDTNYAGDGLVGVLVGYANENKAYAILTDNTVAGTTSATENGTAITTLIGADNASSAIVGDHVTFDESGKVTGGIFESIPTAAIASGYLAIDNPDAATSATAAIQAGDIGEEEASGIVIDSDAPLFDGVMINDSVYTINDMFMTADGSGGTDFTGYGAGVASFGSSKTTVNNLCYNSLKGLLIIKCFL